MLNLREKALQMHKDNQGKLAVIAKVELKDEHDLSLAYSPGVAEPCKEIHANVDAVYDYTAKGNLVAIVSDGTAVLGLGNIGPEAAMPVMEGKAVLFKNFAGVDAFPVCIKHDDDPQKLVEVIKSLEPTFGGINLEDIAAPNCFIIEEELQKAMNIPVFHDDQHGTAIVTLAGLLNALKIVNKKIEDVHVVVNGAGAAGIAIIKLLMHLGVKDVVMCDTKGAIYRGRTIGMNPIKEEVAEITNKNLIKGSLKDCLVDADVFIGVSAPGVLSQEMIRSMANDAIIFAMANPVPEIMPEEAKAAGAKIIGTGRSDYPNQVNNVLAFPGIFRGTLDVRASCINVEMKVAAAQAIADLIDTTELNDDYVIPSPFDHRVAPNVAKAVAKAAMETMVARVVVDPDEVAKKTKLLATIGK